MITRRGLRRSGRTVLRDVGQTRWDYNGHHPTEVQGTRAVRLVCVRCWHVQDPTWFVLHPCDSRVRT